MEINQIYSLTHTHTYINTPKSRRLNPQQQRAQSKALLQTETISHLASNQLSLSFLHAQWCCFSSFLPLLRSLFHHHRSLAFPFSIHSFLNSGNTHTLAQWGVFWCLRRFIQLTHQTPAKAHNGLKAWDGNTLTHTNTQ